MNIKKIIVCALALMMIVTIAQGMNLIEKSGAACSVCFEEEDCYVSTCHPKNNDVMCLECRKNSIAANIDDKEVPHCPVRGCTNVIDQRTMQKILKDDYALLNRCNTFLEEKRKREAGIKPCPTPNCNGEFNSRSGQRSHYCNVCQKSYEIEIGKNEAWRNLDIQECPGRGCSTILQKNQGCNHMTCGTCRHQFCWMCLADWNPRSCSCAHFGPDHATLAARRAILEKLVFAVIGAAPIVYIGYTTVYQTWSQKRKLDLIAQTAEQIVEKILAIEFELFDENNSLLTLQEQFDIDSVLKLIKSDEKRDSLKSAIQAYDISLKAVHDVISSVKYYHQTPEYFVKNEPKLIQKLYTDLDALKQILSSCQSDISLDWKKLIGLSSLFVGGAVGAKWYYFDK